MTELAGVMVGNYFLIECLGREGMVETYRARPTTRGGYDVMLRLFQPPFPDSRSFHEHFATEVEKVWRCHHEHIQTLLEFGTGEDLLYSVTLFPEEETLAQLLDRQQEQLLPIPLVLRYVTQLCAALQYAHDQGIVHGNVQPSSILVRNEDVLLTNFSMKRAYQEGEPLVAQISEGNASYVAPEQAVGMLCPSSDIYAVGVLLYRLLGGRLPYEGESAGEITLKHTNEPIPSLRELRPEVPEALELVVRVALAKTPSARFSTTADFAQALLSSILPEATQVISVSSERRIPVRSRRTSFTWARALTLLVISMLLVGLGGSAFFFTSLPQHLNELPGLSFFNGGSGFSAITPVGTSTGVSAASTPSRESAPPVGGLTPTSGTRQGSKGHGTPVGSVPKAPVVKSTATPGPIPATPVPVTGSAPISCTSGTISIDGSPYLEPLLQQVESDYQAQCPGMTIVQYANGSRVALGSLQAGQIGLAASDLTASPALNLTNHPVVALLYAVIVSPDLQLSGLSSSELQGIYSGHITNWAQVGGPYEPITVILSPASSPINAIFRAFVLDGAPLHVKGIRLKKDAPNVVVQAVAQIPGAISIVPLMAVSEVNVQVLAIDGVSPDIQAMQQGSYSFWSVEHLYTQGDGSAQAQALLQFCLSAQEASIMTQFGTVPINTMQQYVVRSHLPGPEIS